jgi:hypothetical protein
MKKKINETTVTGFSVLYATIIELSGEISRDKSIETEYRKSDDELALIGIIYTFIE